VSKCIDCAEGFPELCQLGGCQTEAEINSIQDLIASGGFSAVDPKPKRRDSRRTKNDMNLKDPQSTGRHRAVAIHGKANPEEPCEWRGLANCGGGQFPILGCADGFQSNLHHGPDKNVLNNDRINIHKICSQCHNRWHTLNDPDYEWDGHHSHHAPRKPNDGDFAIDNQRWKNRRIKTAKD
jgi:hypothetical protein